MNDDRRACEDIARGRAAGVHRARPPQLRRTQPLDQLLRARGPQTAGSRSTNRPQESGGGFTEYRVNGAFQERHAVPDRTRPAPWHHVRAGGAHQLQLPAARLQRGPAAAVLAARPFPAQYTWEFTRVFDNILPPEDQSLIDRLFPQVRLSILSGTVFWNGRTTRARGHQLSTSIDFALPGSAPRWAS